MLRIKPFASMLSGPVLLSGCWLTPAVTVDADALCKDWRHQTVSKDDKITQKTASNMEASNGSRVTWGCKFGRNEAKKG